MLLAFFLLGICVPLEHDHLHPGEIEETIIESFDHGTLDPHPKRTTSSSQLHHLKGKGALVNYIIEWEWVSAESMK